MVGSRLTIAMAFVATGLAIANGRYMPSTVKMKRDGMTPPMLAGKKGEELNAWEKAAALQGALQALEAFDALYAFQSRPRY